MRILLSIVLCLVSCVAAAAQPTSSGPRNALLTWTAPTQFIDGSPITSPITYRVYRGKAGESMTSILTTSQLTYLFTFQPIGNMCYGVVAVVDGTPSAMTEILCKVMTLDAPSDGTIERPTNGSIERRR